MNTEQLQRACAPLALQHRQPPSKLPGRRGGGGGTTEAATAALTLVITSPPRPPTAHKRTHDLHLVALAGGTAHRRRQGAAWKLQRRTLAWAPTPPRSGAIGGPQACARARGPPRWPCADLHPCPAGLSTAARPLTRRPMRPKPCKIRGSGGGAVRRAARTPDITHFHSLQPALLTLMPSLTTIVAVDVTNGKQESEAGAGRRRGLVAVAQRARRCSRCHQQLGTIR